MDLRDTPLDLKLPGAIARKLSQADILTVGDLLELAPRRYYHWGHLTSMSSLRQGDDVTLLAEVLSATLIANRRRSGVRLEVTLTDGTDIMTATFFAANQYKLIPHQRLLTPHATILFAGKVGSYRGKLQLTHPEFEEIPEGDEETARRRQERPIPIYPAGKGLTTWVLSRAISMLLEGLTKDNIPDIIPSEIRRLEHLPPYIDALKMLHQPKNDADYQKARHALAWNEAFLLQTGLLLLRQEHIADHAPQCPVQGHSLIRSSLPFSLTPAQEEAIAEIQADLASTTPMRRLLQGDVGSGKTVIALLAMAQVLDAGYQAAFLVPTEVLAEQHYASLKALVPETAPWKIALLTGASSASERKKIAAAMSSKEPLIVVGTHALIQEGITFASLGIVVVDEQHRFGVAQRDRLREAIVSETASQETLVPHQLVMTATPIPRTIAMTVFADLEETRMRGLPPGRTPVTTHLIDAENTAWMTRLWERAREEIEAGGRVYVVCPRIDEDDPAVGTEPSDGRESREENRTGSQKPLASVESVSRALTHEAALHDVEIATLTGKTPSEEKNRILDNFARGKTPLLVATTVIEVGVDVPDATMMVVMDAQQFGLSQLHQLRGRVGRSSTSSVCMAVHRSLLSPATRQRLEVFASTTDGFELAEADLMLRKEGDVMGAEQSGTASSLKFLSILRDEKIILAARKHAAALIGGDPSLKNYRELAGAIRRRQGTDISWLDRM
ncbi:MAG: ATP-dependent DNA helicase RecG [Actinobacteria bacterium]|nr:MAG: ATP-dependent DNA helicase RecG [Actinomycetota bacterium]